MPTIESVKKAERLIAKVKFWFGENEPIFDLAKYDVEYEGNHYAIIYKKEKLEN